MGVVCCIQAVVGLSCSNAGPDAEGEEPPDTVYRPELTPIGELPEISAETLFSGIQELASDDYEGRAPGSRGEERTVNYLTGQFETMGLQPGNTNGTYVQDVPLVGITSNVTPLVVMSGSGEYRGTLGADFVAWTKRADEHVSVIDSEMVFVGYGIVAPEYAWDDYKGMDVSGKTLVMLVNDPPVPSPSDPSNFDPAVFGGKAMTYYGRWTYKFEIAAEKGATGAFIIHETEPAGYPFSVLQSSNSGERFDLEAADKNHGRAAVEGWVTEQAGRTILELAGQDFDELKDRAATREFSPVPLGLSVSVTLENKLRRLRSRNVVALLEGQDPALKDQYVVYTAHWDHLGVGPEVDGDAIYNGAKDNASGTAGLLEIARAFRELRMPPSRSILFLAPTAEEQGLLGSAFYSLNPIYPLKDTVADINIDGLNVNGRTTDVTLIGFGASSLDEIVRDVAGEQGRIVRPDSEPQSGHYYRSDHFNFAQQGVPALYLKEGVDFVGRSQEYSDEVRRRYTELDYHQPSDEVKSDWDLSGAAEDLKLLFAVGYRVAQADSIPELSPGNEFQSRREAMLEAR